LLGSLTGAAIGSQFGGGVGGHVAGALIGAGVGGLIGNRIGASLDEEDRRRAYAAEIQALESGAAGAPVGWSNPANGRYGSVVPGPAYVDAGRHCRAFTETIYIDGRPQTARGTACRNPDCSWTPLAWASEKFCSRVTSIEMFTLRVDTDWYPGRRATTVYNPGGTLIRKYRPFEAV